MTGIASYVIAIAILTIICAAVLGIGSSFGPGRIAAAIESRGALERIGVSTLIAVMAAAATSEILSHFKRASRKACGIVFALLAAIHVLNMAAWPFGETGSMIEIVVSAIQGAVFGVVPLVMIFKEWREGRRSYSNCQSVP